MKFFADTSNAMIFMVILTTGIFIWSAIELTQIDTAPIDIFLAYLTALTIAIPPGLVACLSVATSISIGRLNLIHNISVSETNRVNYAGLVTFASFDKTGTLTDENVDFQGMLLIDTWSVLPNVKSTSSNMIDTTNSSPQAICNELMATCHNMSILQGKAVGDPLEVELLRASGWELRKESKENEIQVYNNKFPNKLCKILRHFEFTPEKLRAGSIVQRFYTNTTNTNTTNSSNGSMIYYIKGSPEMIISLCDNTTLPINIQEQLITLSRKGYRVLACAYKLLDHMSLDELNSITQSELETKSSLKYLGLVYFTNKLKPGTKEMFEHFDYAKIRSSMITGDHIYTAIAIATECSLLAQPENRKLYIIDTDEHDNINIINYDNEKDTNKLNLTDLFELISNSNNTTVANNPLQSDKQYSNTNDRDVNMKTQIAITGKGLTVLVNKTPNYVAPLLKHCRVFARMKPADKKFVIVSLQAIQELNGTNSKVVFCGDGANDMAALSAATVGVSLCDAETTVAASIVSKMSLPTAVVEVLKEGRCCLITAYCLVNFNIMYAMIQLFMTCYLNNMGLKFGDGMYIVQDLFFSLFLGLSIAYTLPQDTLDVKLPPQRYLSFGIMMKLFGQIVIFPLFQYFGLLALQTQSWYSKFTTDDPLVSSISYESTTVNAIALSQLMIASVVVTIGKPFRKPWYESKIHWSCLAGQFSWVMYILFGKYNDFLKMMSNITVPHKFAGIIIGLIACNIVISAIWTKFADHYL